MSYSRHHAYWKNERLRADLTKKHKSWHAFNDHTYETSFTCMQIYHAHTCIHYVSSLFKLLWLQMYVYTSLNLKTFLKTYTIFWQHHGSSIATFCKGYNVFLQWFWESLPPLLCSRNSFYKFPNRGRNQGCLIKLIW